MDKKLQSEVKNLMKIGLPEDLAVLCGGIKTGNEDAVNNVLCELSDEQTELKEMLANLKVFTPLAIEAPSGELIKPEDTANLFMEVDPITNTATPVEIKPMEIVDSASADRPAKTKWGLYGAK